VNKATKMKKIIRRTFQCLNKQTCLPFYNTMVRSHIYYVMAVWYPYKINHKVALEHIYWRATTSLPGMRDLLCVEITLIAYISISKIKRTHDCSLQNNT